MKTAQPTFDQPRSFGHTSDGKEAQLYCLSIPNCLSVLITNYGGIITELWSPDREGHFADVVLGFKDLHAYEAHSPYFGAIIGRVANRIAKGRFKLKGETYCLATNNAPAGFPCHLHGGDRGFDKVIWNVEAYRNDHSPCLKLSYVSVDGEEGYPGNLKTEVTYSLTPEGTLAIEYEATTDETTVVNLTNHSYFNLKGEGHGSILDHEIEINASHFTPVRENLIPTGELRAVKGTPFDFLTPKRIGQDISHADEQIGFAGGYDHNFALGGSAGLLRRAARVYEPDSGRILEAYTTKPGVQFYTGNFLTGCVGKSGLPYPRQSGFCLETQGFPDAPNQPNFRSIELLPEEIYRAQTLYRFTTDRSGA